MGALGQHPFFTVFVLLAQRQRYGAGKWQIPPHGNRQPPPTDHVSRALAMLCTPELTENRLMAT